MSSERGRWPDPNTGAGALFYAVVAGLIVAVVLALLHHVHLVWS
jgi:hypothetical protein